MKAKTPARLVRWALQLAEFDFIIKYRKGRNNGNADGLSRNPIDDVNSIQETTEIDDVWCIENLHELVCIVREVEPASVSLATMLQAIRDNLSKVSKQKMMVAQREDPNLHEVIKKCIDGQPPSNMKLINDLLYLVREEEKPLLVIPWNLIESVLSLYHDDALSVHLARDRLYEHLKNRFYWYGMYADVSRWTNACLKCQAVKPTRPLSNGLLQPIVTKRPFEKLGMDILGHFPTTPDGFNYVLVCVDLYTSWVEAAPLKTLTAEEVCSLFVKMIVARHGCPETLLTDQGCQFASKVFRKLCVDLGIEHVESAAYHHQTNGKVERFNKFIENSLALLIKPDQRNWDKLLDNVLYVYRTSHNRALDEKPFYLMYGRD